MKGFLAILRFTTRLPIPQREDTAERDLISGIRLMPLAGGIIGAVTALIYRALYGFDPAVAAVAAVLSEIVITGGLHQDGLADTFDGLYSGKDRERTLEVMKDSRLGTHGVLALTGTLLLKVALIIALKSPEALFAAPVFSRLAMVYGAAFSRSARQAGLGCLFINGTSGRDALAASIIAAAITLYPAGAAVTAAALMVTPVIALGVVKLCSRRIGGMTGDTLGALGEIAGLGFLVVYCVVIGIA
jgi:adenosylcobinamide-GDP ribazoletransferase